jgi:3-methyladenine DNA glycosylase/8-oxoguanine DNA glycosylase
MELYLPAQQPFSLNTVIHSHGWVQLAPFTLEEANGEVSYLARLRGGRVAEIRLQEDRGGVKAVVQPALDEAHREQVAEMVTWMLGLDQEFEDFYALTRDEPGLSQCADQAQGRILRCPTLFEDAVKTILTTNTSWAGTIRMVKSLVSQFGLPLNGSDQRHAFPTPAEIATSDVDTLRAETRLGYRAPYILELSRAVDSGALDLEALQRSDLPTAELRQALLSIKGIGEYAAANLLMLLGRYDYLPIDSWARKVVSHEWHQGQPVDDEQVQSAFERWGDWKGLAFWLYEWSYYQSETVTN